MLDQSAVGLSIRQKFTYTWRDVILYNLSVGAGQKELEYVYEKVLKAIPTFGVIPCAATFGTEPYSEQPVMPTSKITGMKKEGTLHMDHKLTLFRPIPVEGSLTIDKVITGVYDRGEGKGAKIEVEITATDESGETVFTNTMGYLNRWAGGFGGPKVPQSMGRWVWWSQASCQYGRNSRASPRPDSGGPLSRQYAVALSPDRRYLPPPC